MRCSREASNAYAEGHTASEENSRHLGRPWLRNIANRDGNGIDISITNIYSLLHMDMIKVPKYGAQLCSRTVVG